MLYGMLTLDLVDYLRHTRESPLLYYYLKDKNRDPLLAGNKRRHFRTVV